MLNKTTIQNIRALVELAQLPKEKCEGAKTIAKRIKAPQNYLAKLLQNLSFQGLVVSQKGRNGGFRLSKNPSEITLFDIAESTENVDRWKNCVFGLEKCCESSPCPLHNRWKNIRESYLEFLQATTLADLLNERKTLNFSI